jgi:hypothetical protein
MAARLFFFAMFYLQISAQQLSSSRSIPCHKLEGSNMYAVSTILLAQGQFPPPSAGSALGGMLCLLIELALAVLALAGMWMVFTKAGKPGWAAIIPFYNVICLLQIVHKPVWWFILFFIPIVNFVMLIIVGIEVAKCFGKETGFGVGLGLLPFVFYPILGWGDAQYRG